MNPAIGVHSLEMKRLGNGMKQLGTNIVFEMVEGWNEMNKEWTPMAGCQKFKKRKKSPKCQFY